MFYLIGELLNKNDDPSLYRFNNVEVVSQLTEQDAVVKYFTHHKLDYKTDSAYIIASDLMIDNEHGINMMLNRKLIDPENLEKMKLTREKYLPHCDLYIYFDIFNREMSGFRITPVNNTGVLYLNEISYEKIIVCIEKTSPFYEKIKRDMRRFMLTSSNVTIDIHSEYDVSNYEDKTWEYADLHNYTKEVADNIYRKLLELPKNESLKLSEHANLLYGMSYSSNSFRSLSCQLAKKAYNEKKLFLISPVQEIHSDHDTGHIVIVDYEMKLVSIYDLK